MNEQLKNRSVQPEGEPPLAQPRKPRTVLPSGSCDSHCHIYGPFARFPLPQDRTFTPHEAPESSLRRLHDHLGFDRAVIVHSQGHGFDHAPLLAALRENKGRYKGVAVVEPEINGKAISEYDEAGICGVRFSFMSHLRKPNLANVAEVIRLVQPFGWHAAVHVAGNGLVEMEDFIRNMPVPVVIDHMARLDVGEGLQGPITATILRLLDAGKIWLKLSGAERLSKGSAPFDDVRPLMRLLISHAPERLLWGSDWPHVNLHGPMPDDGDLVDTLGDLADERTLQRILVENPAKFFGFAESH
ncbi:amidohydrolase [Agrobacterium sp. T29]|uniref:amidohydrolase family protein n=1 Tax=Agrobacterium sp. T29 TaxID=2580515 RepID=UPI001FEFCD44|nr:amidohydrolase family protein [Agrobacterium sp. T29]